MTRTVVAYLTILLAGILACASLACNRPKGSDDGKGPQTAKVTRGNLELDIDATGPVESNLDVEIKCKASGTVTTLPFDVDDRVPKYDPAAGNESKSLLVALDPVDEQHRVDQFQAQVDADEARVQQASSGLAVAQANLHTAEMEAAASLDAATAKLNQAKLTYDRTKTLFDRKTATPDELDNTLTQYKLAQAEQDSAKAKKDALKAMELTIQLRRADVLLAEANLKSSRVVLADARQRLVDTRIFSPIDGVITSRTVEIGQIVASGIVTVGGGTSMMIVSDMSRMFVKANVDESDIGRLIETGKVGQPVTITTDAYAGKRFQGRVVSITPRGNTESNVVTYTVKIEVLSEDKRLLRPKMTAEVKIIANQKDDVLLVPNTAIHYDKERTFVELVKGGNTERRYVKLGLNDGTQAEVLEGLAKGDEVKLSASATKWSNEGKEQSTTSPASGPSNK